MSIFDTLKAMNEQYKATPAAPDNARIPDGKYRAICKEARLIEPSETKPMRLSCSFIIMEGDYAAACCSSASALWPSRRPSRT